MTVLEPKKHHLESPRKKSFVELEDGHIIHESADLVPQIIKGITSLSDQSIIKDMSGEEILFNGI